VSTIEAAIEYIRRGYAPIPIERGKKSPDTRKGWQDERHTEDGVWDTFADNGNVGLILGAPSGDLVDVDLDTPEAVQLAPVFLPPTGMVSGRLSAQRSHYWYRCPVPKRITCNDTPDDVAKTSGKSVLLEVRSNGCQTVVPPSVHPSGELYLFDDDVDPPGGTPAEVDHDTLIRCVSRLAACAVLARRWPGVGVRHEAHLALAGFLLTGGLSGADAKKIIHGVARLTHSDDPETHVRGVDDTLEKLKTGENITGGSRLAELLRGNGTKSVRQCRKWLGLSSEPPKAPGASTGAPTLSDEALALAFAGLNLETLRHCAKLNRWYQWDSCRWVPTEKKEEVTQARSMLRQIATDLGPRPDAKKVASNATVKNVLNLATADEKLAVAQSELDADPWVLNSPEGTIDLHTGEIRAHRREDLITKTTAVTPRGECARWLVFLDEVTGGDQELARFLQRVAGYGLTGSVREHAFFFFYGPGGNGKGVFVDTIRDVLGGYGRVATIDSFLDSKHPQHPTDLASLVGARFVTTSEPSAGVSWDEGKVKRITGGAPIAARFMRGDFFEFSPEFKLVVEANNPPKFRKVDTAVRRRLHVIPFNICFGGDRPADKDLGVRLRSEWPGILSWAVAGCQAWQERGLDPPAAVKAATEVYLEDEDTLGQWLEERTNTTDGDAIGRLWADFQKWLESEGISGWSKRRMVTELRQRGFETRRLTGGVKGIWGVSLRNQRNAF